MSFWPFARHNTDQKETLRSRALFSTYLRPQWQRVVLMVVFLLAGIFLQLAKPQLLSFFIDHLSDKNTAELIVIGAIFIALSLLQQAVTILATFYSENVAWSATNALRTDLIAHCLTLDLAFHKSRTAGEFIERIDGDVNALSNFFSKAFVQLLGNGLLIIGVILLMFRSHWLAGFVMLLFVIVSLLIINSLRTQIKKHWVENMQQSAHFFGFLSEHLIGTQDIRANGATHYVMQHFHRLLRRWYPKRRNASLMSYSMWMTTLFLFGTGNALALTVSGYLYSQHLLTAGSAYLIFYYLNLLVEPLEEIRQQLQDLQQAGAGIERVHQLLQEKPSIIDGAESSLPAGPLAVDFDDVTFGYNADEPLISNFNLHLKPGTILGIVGRTGSGKTTLARLLLRLYDVQEGEICLGQVPVKQIQLQAVRKRIGMVTQDVQLFNATVRNNLTFFNPGINDKRIIETLEAVGLLSWLHSLPQGLDTVLGSDGEGLSAGEAQLLALTRVFLADPGLIILDEASSRLDPATEQLIEKAITRLLANRTAIIIAHRLATLQRVDEILVMADGCCLEHGLRSTLANDPTSHFYHLLQTGLEDRHFQAALATVRFTEESETSA